MAAGARHESSMSVGTVNNWATFAFEQSLYKTNPVSGPTRALSLFNGVPSRTWRDLGSEGGTIFTF